jgi:multicomponent K+:H+ antiporter subunit C
MEAMLALVIGVLGGAGVWLVLRPRTIQLIIGLSLLAYSVNLLIGAPATSLRMTRDKDLGVDPLRRREMA